MTPKRVPKVQFVTATALANFVTGRLRERLAADTAERQLNAARGQAMHREHHRNVRRFR